MRNPRNGKPRAHVMLPSMRRWLFLRGWAREARHWGWFPDDFRAFHPDADITALDLPGAGGRNMEACPADVASIMASCREHARAHGIEPPYHLLGLSLGGMVAAAWARAHRDEIAALVMINSSAADLSLPTRRLRPRNYPALARALTMRDLDAREALVLSLTSRDPGEHPGVAQEWARHAGERAMRPQAALAQLVAATRFRLGRGDIGVPALVLASGGDRLVDGACTRALRRRLNARMAIHPTAGHDLTLDDGPWVAAQVRRWLAQS